MLLYEIPPEGGCWSILRLEDWTYRDLLVIPFFVWHRISELHCNVVQYSTSTDNPVHFSRLVRQSFAQAEQSPLQLPIATLHDVADSLVSYIVALLRIIVGCVQWGEQVR